MTNLNSEGEFLWSNRYNFDNSSRYVHNSFFMNNGNLMIMGEKFIGNDGECYFYLILEENFRVLANREYFYGPNTQFHEICQL